MRLRNWFDKESFMDFAEICEYTKYNKMASARDKFFHGEHHFLLYTERTHFYKRFAIKGENLRDIYYLKCLWHILTQH